MIAKRIGLLILLVSVAALLATPAGADQEQNMVSGEELIAGSVKTLEEFMADPGMGNFRADLKKAHAIMIVPKWTRAGLIFGGSGGNGVVLVREKDKWRGPAFYEFGGGSVGAQIGVSVQKIVMLVMQEKAVARLVQGNVRLGAGVSVAAGTVGTAQEVGSTKPSAADNVDIVSYGKAKGLYAGLVAEGAAMQMLDAVTKEIYGRPVTTQDIFTSGSVSIPKGKSLRDLLAKHTR